MADYRIESGRLYLSGILDKQTADSLFSAIVKDKKLKEIKSIYFTDLTEIDSAGVSCINEIISSMSQKAELLDMNESVRNTYTVFNSQDLPESIKPLKKGIFEQLGQQIINLSQELFEMLILTTDIIYWSIIGLWDKKGQRKGSLIQQGVLIGVEALGIVALLSFIIGLIISLQSATQLKQFGANNFLANLIAISMLRELGPLVTAIIVAGRSGSAIASEIATMKVTEEIDALKMMALNPIRFIVVPKFHAVTFCMPILVLFSVLIGTFGGLLIGVYYLDLSVIAFVNSCIEVTALKDVIISLAKSIVFAWQIVIIGSHYGFQVTGGAEGVGKATTISVVISIFSVILMDALFSLFYMI